MIGLRRKKSWFANVCCERFGASTRLKAANASMNFQLTNFDVQENANRTAAFMLAIERCLLGRDNIKMVLSIGFDFM